jgi:hypothetical protein
MSSNNTSGTPRRAFPTTCRERPPWRSVIRVALSGAILLLAGCGGKPEPQPQPQPAPANLKRVTLHVKDMAERLDLL